MEQKDTKKKKGKKKEENAISMRPSEGWNAEPQTIQRVTEIANMITEGKSRGTIQQHIRDVYKVGERQARAYYGAAMRFLAPDDMEEYRTELIKTNIVRLEKIIEETMSPESTNYQIAIQAIKEINNLMGNNKNTLEVMTQDTAFRISFGND